MEGQGTMPRKNKRSALRVYPEVTADRTPKARKPRKLSGKVIGWDVEMKTPNPWLDPAFKLFRDRRFKRFSKE